MAVAPSELLTAEPGFSPDATGEMPPGLPEAMPEMGDSAPFEDAPEEVVADLPPDAPTDDPDDVAYRASIEAELRPAIEAELTAKFQQDLNNLRSVKDRETAQVRDMLLRVMAKEKVRGDWLNQYFQQNGLDTRDIAVLENHLRQAEDGAVQQQAQMQGSVQGIHDYFETRWNERQVEAERAGLPRLSDADPEVAQWRQWVRQNVAHYGAAAARAVNSPVATQADLQAAFALQEVGRKMHEFETRKRQSMADASANAGKAKVAADQAAARKRQQNRGPQSTANGAGGGGKMTADAAIAEAWKRFPGYSDDMARLKFINDHT